MHTPVKGWLLGIGVLALGTAMSVQAADEHAKIVISGASGQLGREVTQMLLDQGVAPADLILVSRSPDKLKEFGARGAVVRSGDFDEPSTLPPAFAGGTRLLLISSQQNGPKLLEQNSAAIDAAKKDGIRYIVYTSFVNAPKIAKYVLPGHYATEQLLAKSGIEWTAQRDQDYDDNLLDAAGPAIARGEYANNFAPGKAASVSKHDCAAVAAALLIKPSHKNQAIEVTGPQLLSVEDVAALLSELAGKPVKAVPLDDEADAAMWRSFHMPETQVQFFVGLGKAQRAGLFEVRTSIVKQITGHEPMSMREFLAAHREEILHPPPRGGGAPP